MNAVKSVSLGLAVLLLSHSTADAASMRRWRAYWRTALANAATESPAPAPISLPSPAPLPMLSAVPASTQMAAPANSSQPLAWNLGTITQVTSTPVPAPVVTTLSASNAYNPLTKWSGATQVAASTAPAYDYDAMVNLGDGGFAGADQLTIGGARAWYESPVVRNLYNGTPDASQRAAFSQTVLDRVEQTFANSGVSVDVTADPSANAAHMLSVVSNTSYPGNTGAAGITTMGGDGFSFIDNLPYAESVDELQWAVARNVAHELTHAFNVDHHDHSGDFLDAPVASWDTLVAPDTVFSDEAVAELLSRNFKDRSDDGRGLYGAQLLHPGGCDCGAHLQQLSPVPEPGTMLVWGLALSGLAWCRLRGRKLRATA